MPKKLWDFLDAYAPPVIWAGVIFVFSNQSALPGFETSFLDYTFKKGAHIFVYAVLYYLLFRGVNLHQPKLHLKNWRLPMLICLLYAVVDEFHQAFIPNRYPTPRDVGYDMLGVSLVFLRIYGYI